MKKIKINNDYEVNIYNHDDIINIEQINITSCVFNRDSFMELIKNCYYEIMYNNNYDIKIYVLVDNNNKIVYYTTDINMFNNEVIEKIISKSEDD